MKQLYNDYTRQSVTAVIALLLAVPAMTQNVSAPYSTLGIGDVDTRDYGRYFASGSASLARRDAASYNYANPASLSSLNHKTTHFDIAIRGRGSSFSYASTDTFTAKSRDFVVKRVTIAFRPGEKTGMAFGLRPYSSVNYLYLSGRAILDGNESYTKTVDGSGGINQLYFSAGRSLGQHLSAGFTASYLFGSLKRQTNYFSRSIDLNLQRHETNFHYGAQALAGLQYYSDDNKKWRHQLGLTVSATTALKGTLTTEYIDNNIVFTSEEDDGGRFKMPVTVSLGYTATLNNKLSFSADANYYAWPYQKLNYSKSYTNPATRISMGMEYAKKEKRGNLSIERSYLAWGLSAENAYSWIKNKPLWSYAISAGGGVNVSKGISVYGGIETGIRGSRAAGQIKERFTQFVAGITVKDIWLGPRYTRRYR